MIDHAVAGAGASGPGTSEDGPIPPAARRAITRALTDVGPLTFVASDDEVIVEPLRTGPRPRHPDHPGASGGDR